MKSVDPPERDDPLFSERLLFLKVLDLFPSRRSRGNALLLVGLLLVFTVYWLQFESLLTPPRSALRFNDTVRIAEAISHRHLGVQELPPKWMESFVQVGDYYYSTYPLGAVLTMVPLVVASHQFGLNYLPIPIVVALLACLLFLVSFRLCYLYGKSTTQCFFYSLALPVGSALFHFLSLGGSNELTLGFALLGTLSALYCSSVYPKPLLAGVFFAVAFGNRPELVIAFPFYLSLLHGQLQKSKAHSLFSLALLFGVFPFVLLGISLYYNWARFGSPLEFGYSHLSFLVLDPNYQAGVLSPSAIWQNAYDALLRLPLVLPSFPWFRSSLEMSIFLSCPFFLLFFFKGKAHRELVASVLSISALILLVLWSSVKIQESGFAAVESLEVFPFLFFLFLENSGQEPKTYEVILILSGIIIQFL